MYFYTFYFIVTGNDNCVITSSIDRSIKVWDLDYIFENEKHIDKHELTIDSLSISTKAQIAVVVTRSCIGKRFLTKTKKYSSFCRQVSGIS